MSVPRAEKVDLHVRLDADVHARAVSEAEAESTAMGVRISLNWVIEQALRDWAERRAFNRRQS